MPSQGGGSPCCDTQHGSGQALLCHPLIKGDVPCRGTPAAGEMGIKIMRWPACTYRTRFVVFFFNYSLLVYFVPK